MTIREIKERLGFEVLNFQETNNPKWLLHWDADRRVAVSLPVDLVDVVPDSPMLFVTTETRVSESGKEYTAHRILKFDEKKIVASF